MVWIEYLVKTNVLLHADNCKPLWDVTERLMSSASKAIHGQGSCGAICCYQPLITVVNLISFR